MAHHTPDGMGADRYRERQNMKAARQEPQHKRTTHKQYKLRVTRPHPSQDRDVIEFWGTGTKTEMKERKREKEQAYEDSHTFKVVEA